MFFFSGLAVEEMSELIIMVCQRMLWFCVWFKIAICETAGMRCIINLLYVILLFVLD